MKVTGIKCDVPGCGFRERKITVDEKAVEYLSSWLNKPCPKCGKGKMIVRKELNIIKTALHLERFSKFIKRLCGSSVKMRHVGMEVTNGGKKLTINEAN